MFKRKTLILSACLIVLCSPYARAEPQEPISPQPPEILQKPPYSCSIRKTCKQMNSCEEAKFYLKQCGVLRLDRDKDGIPCESLCK